MDWTDDAIVLSARRHGDHAAVVGLLTRAHGLHAGLAHGALGRSGRGTYQPGNRVLARWRARLPEQLGVLSCELASAHAARVMADAGRLAALASACALCEAALPERDPHPRLFAALEGLLDELTGEDWQGRYVRWEVTLLAELGFGLELTSCAVSGRTEGLAYVSPRTGRAVSAEAAGPWRDRLLVLPGFLVEGGMGAERTTGQATQDGLLLTGHFLERHVFGPAGRGLPPARMRLAEHLRG